MIEIPCIYKGERSKTKMGVGLTSCGYSYILLPYRQARNTVATSANGNSCEQPNGVKNVGNLISSVKWKITSEWNDECVWVCLVFLDNVIYRTWNVFSGYDTQFSLLGLHVSHCILIHIIENGFCLIVTSSIHLEADYVDVQVIRTLALTDKWTLGWQRGCRNS